MEKTADTVGVVMLETRFPRLPGDIGNPSGFDFNLLYEVVKGATPRRVVDEQKRELLKPFVIAATRLVDRGADVITTSCGFLAAFQSELQAEIAVPVFTSSLLLMDELEHKYGKGNVGILTISQSAMSRAFLERVGIDPRTPIGAPAVTSEFAHSILSNRRSFDENRCEAELVKSAQSLVSLYPELRALLLECTNMPPHAAAIGRATGLPVYSLNWLLNNRNPAENH